MAGIWGRAPALWPFSADAVSNISVGSGATFEADSATQTSQFLAETPVVNRSNWSMAVYQTTESDPMCEIITPLGQKWYARVPAAATTTTGDDKHMACIQEDGRTAFEFWRMEKVTDNHWTAGYVIVNDLCGTGIDKGAMAGGNSILKGLIRVADLQRGEIAHTLHVGLPHAALKAGPVFPAKTQDGDAAAAYAGANPMGTMFALPPGVSLGSLGLSAVGLMLGRALQDYGIHVMITSATCSLYAELAVSPGDTTALLGAWQTLHPLMRRVTNNTASTIGGGGTRRRHRAPALSD